MIKQQIYDNILARKIGVDYSQGIHFETSLINMDEAQELTMNTEPKINLQKWCWCDSINHSRVTSKDCPVGLANRNDQKPTLGMVIVNPKQIRQHKMQHNRRRVIVYCQRHFGRVKNQIRGNQQEMWCKIWMLRQ